MLMTTKIPDQFLEHFQTTLAKFYTIKNLTQAGAELGHTREKTQILPNSALWVRARVGISVVIIHPHPPPTANVWDQLFVRTQIFVGTQYFYLFFVRTQF